MTLKLLVFIHLLLLIFMAVGCNAQHSPEDFDQVNLINSAGPYLGLVVPNSFELAPLLDPSTFIPSKNVSHIDLSGRRFHVGIIADQKVIVVMTGLAMMNAAMTTQLLLSFFRIKGVVHYGTAGNANSGCNTGDVTIPRQWAHTGLWNWQTYGQGEDDELAWESNGDYTRDIGYIHFANYSTEESCDNLLNNVWFNPDEIFPKNGIPEVREHAFWVNVSETYYNLAEQLQNVTLESCINSTTCLPTTPKIVKVERGCSASILAANAAYKNLLHEKFNCTLIDMESAAVALVSLSMGKPFIIIRALSGLAFSNLASKNAVIALTKFFELLSDKPTNGIEMYDK
ncbi:hypothetical protein SUGI_1137270 [Cryptomeria japonica]|uniref:bark storage protein A isoform X1 n=1 Tax=Cryptomeria japonica TaxID=3369 RepID=UPI0024148524|nr:bark storage protein A isoform X1 [Cryptomeria japonica]GLJ53333.1 hypothetical protein SUGI_1137270 [Cryptomeria japonica]